MSSRRLAAILAADVVGSSRLIETDERYALPAIRAALADVLIAIASRHGGRLIKTMGDGALIEFASPVAAVACAQEVQMALTAKAAQEAAERRVLMRIGINLGDVVAEADGDLHGDGVNVAARLEGLADPGGIAISEKVYAEIQGKLDARFVDKGEVGLKNITRPVRVYLSAGSAAAAVSRPALALPDKPSIAVLPFRNMSGDPEQDYFADGIAEDIITGLSREPTFFVIARNSSFTYKGTVDLRRAGRELGVRYLLEGSVRKAGQRVRVTGQLIEADTSRHLWADRYDAPLDDIFDVQDRVTESVLGAIHPRLRLAESERAQRKRPEDLTAYDLYLRALPHAHSISREGIVIALEFLTRATEVEPGYAQAHGLAAWSYCWQCANAWADTETARRLGLVHAARAHALDSDDPTILSIVGWTAVYLSHEYDRGLELTERGTAINPNYAMGWAMRGWVQCFSGLPEQAIPAFERAKRLSPLDPMSWVVNGGIATALLFLERYDEAAPWWERTLRENPGFTAALRSRAVTYAYLGRTEDASRAVARILAASPGLTVTDWSKRSPTRGEIGARFLNGLRLAGLPD